MKKRFMAVFLAFALCVGLCVPQAFADRLDVSDADLKSTFTFVRNGTIDELEGRYRWNQPALVDDEGGGKYPIFYEVFDQNDSWTITNTGSKAISAGGSTDYTISIDTWSYGYTEERGYEWVGGMSWISTEGEIVHGQPGYWAEPAELKAGESVTIRAGTLAGEFEGYTPSYDGGSIIALSLTIKYGAKAEGDPYFDDDDPYDYIHFVIYFSPNAAQKAALEKANGGNSTFSDVSDGAWYADAVNWAVSKDVTNGTGGGRFSPAQQCTHAQILTFLYRADRGQGKAEAADMDKAVAWAREKGMIDNSFNGKAFCTRADAVNYIWQALGRENAAASGFTDVPAGAGYAKAVDWAVSNGITNGTDAAQTEFSPGKVCDRGTIVTFLHRAYVPSARLTPN